jgi:hypothetical protein
MSSACLRVSHRPDVSGTVLTTPGVVRLAVAAYLARFKGKSRIHTESELRGTSSGASCAAWTRSQRAGHTLSSSSAGYRKSAVPAIDGVPTHLGARRVVGPPPGDVGMV